MANSTELGVSINHGVMTLTFIGDWTLRTKDNIDLTAVLDNIEHNTTLTTVLCKLESIGVWDSLIITKLVTIINTCKDRHLAVQYDGHGQILTLLDGSYRLAGGSIKPARLNKNPHIQQRHAMQFVLHRVATLHRIIAFFGNNLLHLTSVTRGHHVRYYRAQDFLEYLKQASVAALPIVSMLAFLIGVILAFISEMHLAKFGASIYVADLVGIGTTREIGVMLTAIIMTGRTGASFAAEIASMVLNNEINALRILGVPIINYVALPRLIALSLMLPLLTVYADILSMLGGALITVNGGDITFIQYYEQTIYSLSLTDVVVGLVKSCLFAVLIAVSSCFYGLHAKQNAKAVGDATTNAVVMSIVLIIVSDAMITVYCNLMNF